MNKKYNYNINEIIEMRNAGLSLRAIARAKGYPSENLIRWLNRNYPNMKCRWYLDDKPNNGNDNK